MAHQHADSSIFFKEKSETVHDLARIPPLRVIRAQDTSCCPRSFEDSPTKRSSDMNIIAVQTKPSLDRCSKKQTTEQMHHHPKSFRVVVHLFSGLLLQRLFFSHFAMAHREPQDMFILQTTHPSDENPNSEPPGKWRLVSPTSCNMPKKNSLPYPE